MVMAGSYFEKCEEELRQILFNLKQRKGTTPMFTVGGIPNKELQQTQELLDRFSSLTPTLPSEVRGKAEERLAAYRTDLFELKSVITPTGRQPSTDDPQSALLHSTSGQTLLESNSRIIESQRLALESEQIGISVLDDLKRQREQILRTQRTLQETDANVGQSNRLMREMFTRMNVNRFISYALVCLLGVTILMVLYYKLFG